MFPMIFHNLVKIVLRMKSVLDPRKERYFNFVPIVVGNNILPIPTFSKTVYRPHSHTEYKYAHQEIPEYAGQSDVG